MQDVTVTQLANLKITSFEEALQACGPAAGNAESAEFQCRMVVAERNERWMPRDAIGYRGFVIDQPQQVIRD